MFGVANQFYHLLDLVLNGVMLLHHHVSLGLCLLDKLVALDNRLFEFLNKHVLAVLRHVSVKLHL